VISAFYNNKLLRYSIFILAVLPLCIFRDFTVANELRYLSIADEALRMGSIFTFTNHGIVYADKPPLYFWIVMSGKLIFGKHIMLYLVIFSFIPALVILHIMDRWVRDLLTQNERLLAQLMLITSVYFLGPAVYLRMDMLMCMFIVLSLYTFFMMYSGSTKKLHTILFPVYVFLALFTKGPVGLIVPLVSTVVFLIMKRDLKSIGRYWGWKTLSIIFVLCGIWFAGVYMEGGSQYLENLLFHQTVGRAVTSFHHDEPIYYYFLSILYSLAPWSLLIAGVLISGLIKKTAGTDVERFFLVAALSTFAVLSLFSSKLAIYLLPAFPFFVYLTVLWLAKSGRQLWMILLVSVPALILLLALPAVIVAFNFVLPAEHDLSVPVILAGLIFSVAGFLGAMFLFKRNLNNAVITMCTGILLCIFTVSFSVPKYNYLIGFGELCRKAIEKTSGYDRPNYYYCKVFRAANMDVYLGEEPTKLEIKDLYAPDGKIKTPAILFVGNKAVERNDSLKLFIEGKYVFKSGNNSFVEIE
jgi:4-amino-4-deoxy-L-arabinose transferase-like glycosyltransferase